MKGLQLRVQLRIFPMAIGITGFPQISNENHFSAKIGINFSETVKIQNWFENITFIKRKKMHQNTDLPDAFYFDK